MKYINRKLQGKLLFLMAIIFAFTFLVTGCGGTPSIDTGSGTKQATQQGNKQQEAGKKVNVNKKWNVNSLEIIIGEIEISSSKIKVGMTVNNQGKSKLQFYPDSINRSAVIGNIQLESNSFMTEGQISGDIHPGVSKSGVIYFLVPKGKALAVNEINSIDLHLGDILDVNSFSSRKDFNVTIEVK